MILGKARKFKADKILEIINKKYNLLEKNLEISSKNLNTFLILTHGDYHNQNILFLPDQKVAGILAFAHMYIGDGLSDIFHFIRFLIGKTLLTKSKMADAIFLLSNIIDNFACKNNLFLAFNE